jgi:mevalonate kinase
MVKQVPCKTFLVGEYAVLDGGEALGLATSPGFHLTQTKTRVHPDSAVGLFLKATEFFEVASTAPGGFGKSTAEFIFAYLEKNKTAPVKLDSIIDAYLGLFEEQKLVRQKPSGADVVIQTLGHVVYVKTNKADSVNSLWPFSEFGFFLISTGLKVATHDHLAGLDRKKLIGLSELSGKVIKPFLSADSAGFLDGLAEWKEALFARGLVHPEVARLMNRLNDKFTGRVRKDFIIKQCGAFGADVLIIIFENIKKNDIRSILREEEINVIASESDLISGILSGELN